MKKIFLFTFYLYSSNLTFGQEFDYRNPGYIAEINDLSFGLSSGGVIGPYYFGVNCCKGIQFKNHHVFYSVGFYLSGYDNGTYWANGINEEYNTFDYKPGKFTEASASSKEIYIVEVDDPPFSKSWKLWSRAVENGADFYDGDNDGNYNPVDKNGNGEWDFNEDRPDLIGDRTIWFVSSDTRPGNERIFPNQEPKGIEVRHTIFSFHKSNYPELENTFFIRYRIINTGAVSEKFDSARFTIMGDGEVGLTDDHIQCDVENRQAFILNYRAELDDYPFGYGKEAPAVAVRMIQSPPVYIEGETYKDSNNNGIFDDEDVVLDTSALMRYKYLGKEEYPGARQIKMAAFNAPTRSQIYNHPATAEQVRNLEKGSHYTNGEEFTVKNFLYGSGNVMTQEEADSIDPKFVLTGDPEFRTGWFPWRWLIIGADVHAYIHSEKFELIKNKPVEFIAMYTVSQGNDHYHSFNLVKEKSRLINELYLNNFEDVVTDIKQEETFQVTDFKLEQNYPNPFNPATVISYSLPENSNVTIKLFDILGNEVAVLVDEAKSAGRYEFTFDTGSVSRRIASGIYFYQIKADNFFDTKKMLLVK
jgi:hypothetical protein